MDQALNHVLRLLDLQALHDLDELGVGGLEQVHLDAAGEEAGKALFLGRRPNAYVLGLSVAESDALLDALWSHATEPRFAMCHRWKVGDLLMWNNLSVLHRRDPFDPATRRVMHRSQIKSTAAPVAYFR